MDIEFDPAKDAINRDKHDVPLAFGEDFFGRKGRRAAIRPGNRWRNAFQGHRLGGQEALDRRFRAPRDGDPLDFGKEKQ